MAANPELMRWWARWVADLGTTYYRGSNHSYLSGTRVERFYDGEVQIFRWFTAMVHDAVRVRDELYPGTAHRELLDIERTTVHAALSPNHVDRSTD